LPDQRHPVLSVEDLRRQVEHGDVDTVLVAITDMQGRLQGKRLHARNFLDVVLEHATEACNYLLAVDVDMNTVEGYAMSSWSSGYGDFVMQPDLATLRPVPWQPGTVMVLADLRWEDGGPVVASPRQVLAKQTARLADAGMAAYVGTELEFLVFRDTYEQAWTAGYRNLTPANQYNVDYSLLGTARIEPLLRRIRNDMSGAGLVVESAKGECNLGQHEIAFRYDEASRACDGHVIYKNGAKEIAAQEGVALTFMAKFDAREGNSCHIHCSFRGTDGSMVMADGDGLSALGKSYIAGQIRYMRELTLFLAPNINSYKRYVEGSFAPTALRWGRDNRTCAFRLVGHGASLRLENRIPGGDHGGRGQVRVDVAAGLAGIEEDLDLEPAFDGNAYDDADADHVPTSLAEALDVWRGSDFARRTFGDDVVEHYANMAAVELAAFDRSVTDWERVRGFERL
jgi:glutamine synthetase